MFFSLVVIYIMNVLLLTVFLVAAARKLSFAGYLRDLIENGHECAAFMVKWARVLWHMAHRTAQ